MHTHDLSSWTHHHRYTNDNLAAESSTRIVTAITLAAMLVEIVAGWWFNSMALLADGWHMSSHAVALGLSAYAYATARRLASDTRYAFGTWKIEVLGAFASAVLLLGVALIMVLDSAERLVMPQPIRYVEALVVAVFGLAVNGVCAVILGRAHHHPGAVDSHAHDHDDDHDHAHGHGHGEDLNLRSAFVHVAADAATSVLAIAALFGGLYLGWGWLDPAMGIVGAGVIVVWAVSLLKDTAKVLLDREMDAPVVEEIRAAVETGAEAGATRVTDLHVWRVGREHYACALSLVTHDPALTPKKVREQLAIHDELVHLTIEIHQCE